MDYYHLLDNVHHFNDYRIVKILMVYFKFEKGKNGD